jgi:hypothetical protein
MPASFSAGTHPTAGPCRLPGSGPQSIGMEVVRDSELPTAHQPAVGYRILIFYNFALIFYILTDFLYPSVLVSGALHRLAQCCFCRLVFFFGIDNSGHVMDNKNP